MSTTDNRAVTEYGEPVVWERFGERVCFTYDVSNWESPLDDGDMLLGHWYVEPCMNGNGWGWLLRDYADDPNYVLAVLAEQANAKCVRLLARDYDGSLCDWERGPVRGFVFVTEERAEELGLDPDLWETCVAAEMEAYNLWVLGQVWLVEKQKKVTWHSDDGRESITWETVDSSGGIVCHADEITERASTLFPAPSVLPERDEELFAAVAAAPPMGLWFEPEGLRWQERLREAALAYAEAAAESRRDR